MDAVRQSGRVTPNHIARWATNGVIEDGGVGTGEVSSVAGFVGVVTTPQLYGALVGTTTGTLAAGNDSRIVGALQSGQLGAPGGVAQLNESSQIPFDQLPVGTVSSTVAAGNDARIVGSLQIANDLSELSGTATVALKNLGSSSTLVTITPARHSVTTIGAGIGTVIVSGNAQAFTLVLPTVPTVVPVKILAALGSYSLLYNTNVTVNAGAGQTIGGAAGITLPLSSVLEFRWDFASASWTLSSTPYNNAHGPIFTADFANQIYQVDYGAGLQRVPFSSLFTFSRLGTATYIDQNGIMQIAPAGSPRFDCDPGTFSPLGLLLETNAGQTLISGSDVNGIHAGTNGQLVSTNSSAVPALLTANRICEHQVISGSSDDNMGYWQPSGLTAGTGQVLQSYIWIPSSYSSPTMPFINMSGTGVTTSTIVTADTTKRNQWQLQWAVGVLGAGITTYTGIQRCAGNTGDTFYTTCWSAAPGVIPQSYIPSTGGVGATRVAESISLAPEVIALLASGSGGTIGWAARVDQHFSGVTGPSAILSDGISQNQVVLEQNFTSGNGILQAITTSAGTTTSSQQTSVPVVGTPFKLAIGFDGSNAIVADSLGGASTAAAGVVVSPMSTMTLTAPASIVHHQELLAHATRISTPNIGSMANTYGAEALTVRPDLPGITIPANFLGLSFETLNVVGSAMTQPTIIPMITALAPAGVIRVGGGSSDEIPPLVPSSGDLTNLAGLLSGTGWSLIYGLDLQAVVSGGAASQCATQAASIAAAVGVGNIQFQIGNEPDLYSNSGWSFSAYQSAWLTVRTAVLGSVPSATFAGPDLATTDSWLGLFNAALGAEAVQLSRHYYSQSGGGAATIAGMLSSDSGFGTLWKGDMVTAGALPLRMTECNSVSGGGQAGVSNVLAAPLWGLNFMFQIAKLGGAGLNIHGVTGSTYAPLLPDGSGKYAPQPIYYAMLAFGPLAGGVILPCSGQHGFLQTIAVACLDGNVRVIIVNRSAFQQVSTRIKGGSWSSASAMVLIGVSGLLTDTSVSLGGAQISDSGVFTPTPYVLQRLPSGFPVLVPPASAVVVTLT